jgi:hypothetical protein
LEYLVENGTQELSLRLKQEVGVRLKFVTSLLEYEAV